MEMNENFDDIENSYNLTSFENDLDNCTHHRYLNVTMEHPIEYAVPFNGYVIPFLCVVTLVTNTLVIAVLSMKHMRTPTNSILLAIALADVFTILSSVPWHLYMYTFGNHVKPFYPLSACYAWNIMNSVVPNLFHTASIWLTVALAVQRYISVCHNLDGRTWCTMSRVQNSILCIFFAAALHQSTRFVDTTFTPCNIMWEGQHHLVCKPDLAYWVEFIITPHVYFNIYFWFRVLFVHTVPCVVLVVVTLLLLRAIREAQRQRNLLVKNNRKSAECKKIRDFNCTTMMLVIVVLVFLIVELPLAIVTVLHIISSTILEFLDYEFANVFIFFSNFVIILTFPVNFAIYCSMSRQFRKTLKYMFVKKTRSRRDRSNSDSLIVEESRTMDTNETVL